MGGLGIPKMVTEECWKLLCILAWMAFIVALLCFKFPTLQPYCFQYPYFTSWQNYTHTNFNDKFMVHKHGREKMSNYNNVLGSFQNCMRPITWLLSYQLHKQGRWEKVCFGKMTNEVSCGVSHRRCWNCLLCQFWRLDLLFDVCLCLF